MPKAKTDPKYAVAAKLTGWARVRYLRDGHFTGPAAGLVARLKFYHDCARAYREKHPYPPFPDERRAEACRTCNPEAFAGLMKDADELRAAMIKSAEDEVADVLTRLRHAIVKNDAALFRAIAAALDHDTAHGERHVALTDPVLAGNKVLTRDPANKLAAIIAAWSAQNEEKTQPQRFSDLWDHLCAHDDLKRVYSNLRSAKRVKAAKQTVRKIARGIGVQFDADRHGPKTEATTPPTARR